jgi:hypothetical protein
MAEAVYVLCAATSIVCAVLLFRTYRRRRSRLLLWSSVAFIGLAINNLLLFVDLVLAREVDLSVWRNATALVALMVLLFGLIWDAE